jgi:hypothetical protein
MAVESGSSALISKSVIMKESTSSKMLFQYIE